MKRKAEVRASDLLKQGYVQISRRYRIVARLPRGKTGLEALEEADPALVEDWLASLEERATEQYLRVYAPNELKETLTEEEFNAFLRLRGR